MEREVVVVGQVIFQEGVGHAGDAHIDNPNRSDDPGLVDRFEARVVDVDDGIALQVDIARALTLDRIGQLY